MRAPRPLTSVPPGFRPSLEGGPMTGNDPTDRTERLSGRSNDGVAPLGPPGWDDYAAARAAFMRTLAVDGLERAWRAPAHSPGRRAGTTRA
jgi:hypothetical protein